MTKPTSIYENIIRDEIKKLGVSPAPMIELGPLVSYINSECPRGMEERRDSLLSLARHVANKQRERIRDGQMIGRMAG